MASTMAGDAPLHLHLGGDPGLQSRLAIAEIQRTPANGMHARDMHGILRMAAILCQLAADLQEAFESTTGGLELPWWRLDTVQKLLGITPSNEHTVINTVSRLEGLAKQLASITQAGCHQTGLFSDSVAALTPWVNVDITEFLKLEEEPQPA